MLNSYCLRLALITATLLSCGAPLPLPPPPPPPSKPSQVSSHCDILADTLKKTNLECLGIPGYVSAGVYGSINYPNESTLEAGFGHQIPAGVIGSPRPGGTMTMGFSTTKSTAISVGLSLSQFYAWLPDAKFSASVVDEFEVQVTLGELSLTPIQNLPEEILPIIDSINTDSRTVAVRNMLGKLCAKDTVVSTMVLTAKPAVVLKNKSRTALNLGIGWKNIVGFNVDDTKLSSGLVGLTSTVPIAFAAQLRTSGAWVHNLCQMPPCGGDKQACCAQRKCSGGLICAGPQCTMPPPPPPPVNPDLTSTKVTWTTTDDDKDWNTQPVVDVYDQRGRVVAHIDCCSSDRNDDKWGKGRLVTRDLKIVASGVKLGDLAHGRFSAKRNPVGNDDWDYDVVVELLFSDIVVRRSCHGRNSCDASW